MKVVSERQFYIWKLEFWWVAFNALEFYPKDRKPLGHNWFWRK